MNDKRLQKPGIAITLYLSPDELEKKQKSRIQKYDSNDRSRKEARVIHLQANVAIVTAAI